MNESGPFDLLKQWQEQELPPGCADARWDLYSTKPGKVFCDLSWSIKGSLDHVNQSGEDVATVIAAALAEYEAWKQKKFPVVGSQEG